MYTKTFPTSGRLSSSPNLQNVPSSTRDWHKATLYASLYGGTNKSLTGPQPPCTNPGSSRHGPIERTGLKCPAVTKYSTLRRVTRYGMTPGMSVSYACLPSGPNVQRLCPLMPREFGLKNRLVQEVKCACCARVVAYHSTQQRITRLRVCRLCRFTGQKLNPIQLLANAGKKIVYV